MRLSIRLAERLVVGVDEARGDGGCRLSRSQWIAEAVEFALAERRVSLELLEGARANAGVLTAAAGAEPLRRRVTQNK